jgi:hypothetical protein
MVIHPKQLEEEDTHHISTVAQTNMTISATHSNLVGALCVRPNTICVPMKAMSPAAKIRWRCSANLVIPKLYRALINAAVTAITNFHMPTERLANSVTRLDHEERKPTLH